MCKEILTFLIMTLTCTYGSFLKQEGPSESDKEFFFVQHSSRHEYERDEEKSFSLKPQRCPHSFGANQSTSSFKTPKKTSRPLFFLTNEQREKIATKIPQEGIYKLELLQTALLRSPHGKPYLLESYFNQEELNDIIKILGNDHDLVTKIISLKSLYPMKIPQAKITQQILTPAARLVFSGCVLTRSRSLLGVLAMSEASEDITHVTASLFAEEDLDSETPEERTQRLQTQEKLFKELEENRGVQEVNRAEQLANIETLWQNYFEYFTLRIKGINEATAANKITSAEIAEVFTQCIADAYIKINVDGCSIYLNPNDVQLSRTNFLGETNLELLSRGVAPIGADGNPMNLHHMTRRHPGIIVLMTESFHQKHTDLLHFRSEKYMRQPTPVDRIIFSRWKIEAFEAITSTLKAKL